ncbi:hypothetical protein EDC94DRAFT_614534 [Helicostylum pulchrum]|nr:hypothetical protein EDC94DRAFT_614534 [Helicostylum pulchrum]
MIKLYQELLPKKESHDRRIKFVKLMDRLMNTEWPDHDIKAHVFGSSVNDLGTSSSDVDLCITTPWNGLRNVKTLAKLFRKSGMQHVVCVPRAKVPIVRLFDPELQLSCDINVNNTLALQNTKMIKAYVALDSRVRPLIMIIKHWTKQRLLNDAANGGTLSSYTWTCMIINFLQQRQPPVLPVLHHIENENKDEDYFFDNVEKLKGFGAANQESLGGLLFAFFRRFAVEFDYHTQVVSVRQGRYLLKTEKGWDTGRNKMSLCAEEPFNVSRNLGNSADIASVQGLRCEFQRFLEMLIAGEDLETICAPYRPMSVTTSSTTEIPPYSNSSNSNTLTLTLPAENRTSSFFLPIYPYSDYSSSSPSSFASNATVTTHPYDRRRSMVDGICSYPSAILSDTDSASYPVRSTSYTFRAPPISKPCHTSFNPRFSSSQALDTILRVRNTRHGSHPLPPVPSTLLSMLNISANHGTDQSVDKIFARYHKKQQQQSSSPPPPPPSSKASNEGKATKKNPGAHRRKGTNHSQNNRHHFENNRRLPRRRSSVMDWPTICKNNSNPQQSSSTGSEEEPQRLRRWSTTKKQQQMLNEEPKQRTLAEIVKIATPTIKQKSAPSSPIPSASVSASSAKGSSSSNRNRRQRNANNNKSSTTASNASISNKQRKKNSIKAHA